MNPLSPLMYYYRHKRNALLQVVLISVATAGLFVLVAVLDAIPLRANVSYLTVLSRVSPIGDMLEPALVSSISINPDVERIIPENGLMITLPTLIGTDSQRILGVSQEDAQVLMEHSGVRLKEGRMFEPRSPEIILSEEVARALDLQVGSEIGRSIDTNYYESIPSPLVLVGILEGDPEIHQGPSVRMGFISSEYLNSHELYAPRRISILVISQEGRKAVVEEFLENTVRSKNTDVETFSLIVGFLKMARIGIYFIFGVVNSIVAVAISFVVGVVNRIAMMDRLREFGLLHALGRQRQQLIQRLTLETAVLSGLGWTSGLGLALLVMLWIKNTLFYHLGMELDLFNISPYCFVAPIPLIIIALAYRNSRKIFNNLDAITIIERGRLSAENAQQGQTTKRSYEKPLSFITFSLRHRRRSVLVVLSTTLLVLSVTLPVFLLSSITGAMKPYFQYLQHVSVIQASANYDLDPGIISQIRSNPAVAHTFPTIPLSVRIALPLGSGTDVYVFGVSETDLLILLDTCGLHLQEGRLPQTGSNEIVLSSTIALNRDFQVGDIIGGDTDTNDEMIEDNIPVEMEIVGILSPDRPWLGFASYEFLNAHELTSARSRRWIIIPYRGQKQVMDSWLLENVDSTQGQLVLHESEEREFNEMTTSIVLTFAVLECMIAAVAAVGLAALNTVFFNQRKTEFGILNAIGYSRMWLVLRTMKETVGVVSIAWVIGAGLCGIGLFSMHIFYYGPQGLTLDFSNPTPWLLTLPIPIAVVASSAGVVARMLRKLDPVEIVERR
jgi:ABC-type antimicrobial peptide transport system permease subunit